MHIGAASSSLPGSASALPAIAPPPRLGHSRLGPSRPRRPSSILAVLARRPTHHPSLAHPRDAGALAPAGYSGWGAKYRRTSSAKSEANAASVCSFLRLLLSIITLLILFVLLSESTETLRATAVHFIRGEGVRLHDTMVCRLGAGPQRGSLPAITRTNVSSRSQSDPRPACIFFRIERSRREMLRCTSLGARVFASTRPCILKRWARTASPHPPHLACSPIPTSPLDHRRWR